MPSTNQAGIDTIQADSRKIFINSRFSLRYLRKAIAHKPLHLGKGSVALDYIALAFAKRSPLYNAFNVM